MHERRTREPEVVGFDQNDQCVFGGHVLMGDAVKKLENYKLVMKDGLAPDRLRHLLSARRPVQAA